MYRRATNLLTLSEPALTFPSYVNRLQQHASANPDCVALVEFHQLKEARRTYSYADMDRRCRAIAAHLQLIGAKGERALLAFDNDPDYLLTFLACFYAGVIAVPVFAPTSRSHAERFVSVAKDCGAKFLLTTQACVARNGRLGLGTADFPDIRWVLTEQIADDYAWDWTPHYPQGPDIAYLQYTSGSTGQPRGVMVSHSNLIYQGAYIEAAAQLSSDDRTLSWLPLYHDMGLIVGALQAIYTGFPLWLTTPAAVVMHPERWLQAISDLRITFAGAPNFLYDLCVDAVNPEKIAGIDLSSWSIAFNSAEPIRATTLSRFADAFGPFGLPSTALHPAYGLAEATLAVTMKKRGAPAVLRSVCPEALKSGRVRAANDEANARILVSSGRFIPDTQIQIVNPATKTPCAQNEIGEIWVTGSGPAQGYWKRETETQKTFSARLPDDPRPYLRTGDMGFVDTDNNLFVTGRLKDLIIIAGKNHYPQDIEHTVESTDPAIRNHAVAAVSIERNGAEQIVVIAEIARPAMKDLNAGAVAKRIQSHVASQHQVTLAEIVLVHRGQLPMTTSGKIQRKASRNLYDAGQLNIIAQFSYSS